MIQNIDVLGGYRVLRSDGILQKYGPHAFRVFIPHQ